MKPVFEKGPEGGQCLKMVDVWACELRSRWKLKSNDFWAILRSPENFKIFRRQKKYFFRVQKILRNFFSKKVFENFDFFWKSNISLKKIINFFWTRIFEFKKFPFFYFWKSQYFSDFEKMLDFFLEKNEKSVRIFFWTRKKYFFVGEKFWNFCGISEHVETPKIQIFSPIRLLRNERRPYHFITPPQSTISISLFILNRI